ncbi:MAG TPA: SDR family oxidoreductase, partial [Acidobacteriota bacterium]|nr:SDR family oxidoreductase [Acidobacteriota bacterium]
RHVVAQTVERFGRVDILINNAGITWKAPAETMSLDRWNQVMTVNVTGAFLMAQAVYPEMLKVGGGKIVNIASVAGLAGSSAAVMDAVGYNASKGAMISMSRDLAVKWAPKGIYVNAVAPGFFPTRMTEALLSEHQEEVETATPLGRVGQENELKGAVLFLASRASDFVVGQVLVVDGGATAW